MEPQNVIAKRIAQELRAGMLVNLGIGIPTLVANYVPQGVNVFLPIRKRAYRHRADSGGRHGSPDTDGCWRPARVRIAWRLYVR